MMNQKRIKELYKTYAVPKNIRLHMQVVAQIAVFLATKINEKQENTKINIRKLRYAALTHDLVKVCEFDDKNPIFASKIHTKHELSIWRKLKRKYSNIGHIEAAYKIFCSEGEQEIATIIKKHDYSSVIEPDINNRPNSLEEKLLYYADKRVLHDGIVSLKYRFKEGRLRYLKMKTISKKELEIEQKAQTIEKELCHLADIAPKSINDSLLKT